MRFSASSLGAAIALPALASAVNSYNATFHTSTNCKDASPHFTEGERYTNCVALNGTFNSIRAYEDLEIGYCHYFLYSDEACKKSIASDDILDGSCQEAKGFRSYKASCYR